MGSCGGRAGSINDLRFPDHGRSPKNSPGFRQPRLGLKWFYGRMNKKTIERSGGSMASDEARRLNDQPNLTLGEFDLAFLSLLRDLGKQAMAGARSCTEAIFELSSNYVDKPAFEALRKFYDLYFADEDLEERKAKVHREVDTLVDELQTKMARGESLDEVSSVEDQSNNRTDRLGLAGVQKQLEGLITLDEGIRTQILPALASMQFEDAVTQRIDHVVSAWARYASFFEGGGQFTDDFYSLAKEAAQHCTSVEETQLYYNVVLEEEAPEGEEHRSIFLEF